MPSPLLFRIKDLVFLDVLDNSDYLLVVWDRKFSLDTFFPNKHKTGLFGHIQGTYFSWSGNCQGILANCLMSGNTVMAISLFSKNI